MPGYRNPAVMVQGAIAEHLEVLRVPLFLRLRVVEAVHHADALDGLLRHAVELGWCGNVRCLQDRGHEINHVVELGADPPPVLDARRPRDDDRVACTTEMRRNLLAPLEGRV